MYNRKKKVLFTATIKGHIKAFHIPYLKLFKEQGYETYVATKENENMTLRYCDHFLSIPFERNPFHKNNIKAYKILKSYLEREHFDIIHCHTPVASTITRLAGKKCRKKGTKIFYTAHGFHFYNGASLRNWILYFPIEKWLAQHTDVLITINQEDYLRAKKKFSAGKVEYIPGIGVNLEEFDLRDDFNRVDYRKKLKLKPDDVMLLSVGELNKNKNHQIVIKALAEINNPKFQYFIAGKGNMKDTLLKMAKDMNISEQIHLLGFRKDISELLASSDMFVFPSYREGLSLALMEAMASGTMIICSDIRGNRDLIEDGYNGYLFGKNDVERLKLLIESVSKMDESERVDYFNRNKERIKKYDVNRIIDRMYDIYGIKS